MKRKKLAYVDDCVQFRRRHGVGVHVAVDGETECRVCEEVEARVLRVPSASYFDGRRRAVQLNPDDAHDPRTLGLRLHG